MHFLRYARAGNWPVLLGYAFFTGMMAVGYWYNVTFVQLGLKDLGERVLGLPASQVAAAMALLALATCLVALLTGSTMQRRGWNVRLPVKLRLAFLVVLLQTVLTAVAPHLPNGGAFLTWILLCSLALGIGVPATFSLTTDLIPVGDRGYVAGAITALAYFAAAVWTPDWQIEPLARQMLWIMVPGVLLLAPLAWRPPAFVAELAANHTRPRFAQGRLVTGDGRLRRRFVVIVVLMFAIYFIDSLGFLRIIDTPQLIGAAWQAPDQFPRSAIGAAHILTALLAGVLYAHLDARALFFWVFGLFGLTHLMYTFPMRLGSGQTLAEPLLYAAAVSLYTVLNFAIWADLSTPETIARNSAVGVALSGWSATFLSTGLAINWQAAGIAAEQHLRYVDALAVLFFVVLLAGLFWPTPAPAASGTRRPAEERA